MDEWELKEHKRTIITKCLVQLWQGRVSSQPILQEACNLKVVPLAFQLHLLDTLDCQVEIIHTTLFYHRDVTRDEPHTLTSRDNPDPDTQTIV